MSARRKLVFVTYDVFTKNAFKGNPLAIVKVPQDFSLSQNQKQTIAREFNFSETVFLHDGEQASNERKVDIFTTTEELPFAGHPTIGTICSIATGSNVDRELTLLTKAGPIASVFNHESGSAVATIPHNVHIHNDRLERAKVEQLLPALGDPQEDDLLRMWSTKADVPSDTSSDCSTFPVVSIVKGMSFILIDFPRGGGHLQRMKVGGQLTYANALVPDEDWLPTFIAPYFYEILSEEEQALRIRARMIEPSIGEDPATGSAASTLGAYLSLQRGKAGGFYRFVIEQGIEMERDSEISIEVTLNQTGNAVESLKLSGSAVMITEGTILL